MYSFLNYAQIKRITVARAQINNLIEYDVVCRAYAIRSGENLGRFEVLKKLC